MRSICNLEDLGGGAMRQILCAEPMLPLIGIALAGLVGLLFWNLINVIAFPLYCLFLLVVWGLSTGWSIVHRVCGIIIVFFSSLTVEQVLQSIDDNVVDLVGDSAATQAEVKVVMSIIPKTGGFDRWMYACVLYFKRFLSYLQSLMVQLIWWLLIVAHYFAKYALYALFYVVHNIGGVFLFPYKCILESIGAYSNFGVGLSGLIFWLYVALRIVNFSDFGAAFCFPSWQCALASSCFL
jgi:hypothetical protein